MFITRSFNNINDLMKKNGKCKKILQIYPVTLQILYICNSAIEINILSVCRQEGRDHAGGYGWRRKRGNYDN